MQPIALPVAHVHQPGTGDCLPACVEMVLSYLNVAYSPTQVARLLKVIPGIGAPAFNVQNMEQLGLQVAYRQGTLRILHSHLVNGSPSIVFLSTGELPYWTVNVDHAVVLVGMDGTRAFVNDPAFAGAPISIPLGDFDLAWLEHNEMYAVITL